MPIVAETALRVPENVVMLNGPAHPTLGARVAELLDIEVIPTEYKRFADTETYFRIKKSIRGSHVLAFQTHAPVGNKPISDSFDTHLKMIDGAVLSDAADVTAVAPNVAGSRQERQVLPRESVSGVLNMVLLQAAGANRLVTVDIHDQHTLHAFRTPNKHDHLTAQPLLRSLLARKMKNKNPEQFRMVSPDEGHSKIIRKHAEALGVDLLDMVKVRDPHEEVVTHRGNIGGLEGITCLMMDDMIGTGGTIASASYKLHEAGAKAIYVAATHGWFSKNAAEILDDSPINSIYVTDTLPISDKVRTRLGSKLKVVSSAEIIADGLREILTFGSVSAVYGEENYS